MMKISVDILILEFYGYIINIGKISVDNLKKNSMKRKLFKIYGNTYKNLLKKKKKIE